MDPLPGSQAPKTGSDRIIWNLMVPRSFGEGFFLFVQMTGRQEGAIVRGLADALGGQEHTGISSRLQFCMFRL